LTVIARGSTGFVQGRDEGMTRPNKGKAGREASMIVPSWIALDASLPNREAAELAASVG
jgi:hypothetical protein